MGPPDLENEEESLYGPGWHVQNDEQEHGAVKWVTGDRRAQVEEYLRGPSEFYERLGIEYVEHGVADENHNNVKDIFPAVCKDLHAALKVSIVVRTGLGRQRHRRGRVPR